MVEDNFVANDVCLIDFQRPGERALLIQGGPRLGIQAASGGDPRSVHEVARTRVVCRLMAVLGCVSEP